MGIKEKVENSPNSSGVYIFKDKESNVIYVGKAASIKKRLKSHFAKIAPSKQRALIDNAADIDYILTPDESTALLLEAALIKRYNPKYNVALRDDKSYPRLKLTVSEQYPRLFIARKIKDDGALYFGPYTNAKLLRKALMFTRRIFPLRTCRNMPSKLCLNFHIGQCIGPCEYPDRQKDYLNIVQELKLFLEGKQDELLDSLAGQMEAASEAKDFEKAAKIRDRITALSSLPGAPATKQSKPFIYPSRQIEELRSILNLPKTPSIIEAFDVSNISGKEATGSMVYFKDAKPGKDQYRHFKIKTVRVIDDYSMMREIVSRRYRRLLEEKGFLPDLIIIDGGKGHLAAAKKELRNLKLWQIPVISIAKGLEKIYVSEDKEPILLGKFEAALLLIQRIRDEAHRFAIGYHRLLRRKTAAASELDEIEGIGPKKKLNLIKHFGTVDEIKMADVDDLLKVRFISEKEAKAIYSHFH